MTYLFILRILDKCSKGAKYWYLKYFLNKEEVQKQSVSFEHICTYLNDRGSDNQRFTTQDIY